MKISIRNLKNLLKEMIEKPLVELEPLIASMDPDDVADDDYVSSDTGEFHLEKGKKARTSPLHPEYKQDKAAKKAERDAEYARQQTEWDAEDEEYEASKAAANTQLQASYEDAIREYAGNWVNFRREFEDAFEAGEGETVAADAAEGFFANFPDWKQWAYGLRMSKEEMKSSVADFIYEAIRLGRLP